MLYNARVSLNNSTFGLSGLPEQLANDGLYEGVHSRPALGTTVLAADLATTRYVSPGARPVVRIASAGAVYSEGIDDILLLPHVTRDNHHHGVLNLRSGRGEIIQPIDGTLGEAELSRHTLKRRADNLIAPVAPGVNLAALVSSGMYLDVIGYGLAGLCASLAALGQQREGVDRQIHPIDASESVFPLASSLREGKFSITDSATLASMFDNEAGVGMGVGADNAPAYVPIYIPGGGQIDVMSVFSSLSRNDGQPFYRETKSCFSALSGWNVRVICVVEGGAIARPLPRLGGQALVHALEGALAVLLYNGYPMDRFLGHYQAFIHNTPLWSGKHDWRILSEITGPRCPADLGDQIFPHNEGPGGNDDQDPDVDGQEVPPAGVGNDLTDRRISAAIERDLGPGASWNPVTDRVVFGTYSRCGYGLPLPDNDDLWACVRFERIRDGELGYFIPCNNRDTTVHQPGGRLLLPRFDDWRDEDANGAANAPQNCDIAGPGFARAGQQDILQYGPLAFIPEYGRSRLFVVLDTQDVAYPAIPGQDGLLAVPELMWQAEMEQDETLIHEGSFPYPDFTGLPNYDEDFVIHAITDYAAFNRFRVANAALPLAYYLATHNNLGKTDNPFEEDGELPLRFQADFDPLYPLPVRSVPIGQNLRTDWPRLVVERCVSDDDTKEKAVAKSNTLAQLLRLATREVFPNMPGGALKIGAERFSVAQVWAKIWAWSRWPDWVNSLRHEIFKAVSPPNPYGYIDGRHCQYVGGQFMKVDVTIVPGMWPLAFIKPLQPGSVYNRRVSEFNFPRLLSDEVVNQTFLGLRCGADLCGQYYRVSRLVLDGSGGQYYPGLPDVVQREAVSNPSCLRKVGVTNALALPHLITSVCGQVRDTTASLIVTGTESRLYAREAAYRYARPEVDNLRDTRNWQRLITVPQLLRHETAIGLLLVAPLTGALRSDTVQFINGVKNVGGDLVFDPVPAGLPATRSLMDDLILGMALAGGQADIGFGFGQRRILHAEQRTLTIRAALGALPTDVLDDEVMVSYAPVYLMTSLPYSSSIIHYETDGTSDWWGDNASQPGLPENRDPAHWGRLQHVSFAPPRVNRTDVTRIAPLPSLALRARSSQPTGYLPNETAAIIASLAAAAAPPAPEAAVDTGLPDPHAVGEARPEDILVAPAVNVDAAAVPVVGAGEHGADARIKLDPLIYAQLLTATAGSSRLSEFLAMYTVDDQPADASVGNAPVGELDEETYDDN